MLKKIVVLVGLLLLSQMAQAEIKIGVVYIPLLMENSPQAAEAKKRLEKEFSPKEKQLAAQQKKIKNLEEKLARESMVMTKAKKRDLEREIISVSRDAQRDQQEFKEDYSIRRHEELRKIQSTIIEAVKALATEDDYDLLLTEGVIHASSQLDVTDKVQAKLTNMP